MKEPLNDESTTSKLSSSLKLAHGCVGGHRDRVLLADESLRIVLHHSNLVVLLKAERGFVPVCL